ncbi:MAG TPA: FtsX-like permease family protein [Patescibacteria group bacterium]|nr:FtsX-like permease family protein [Patescibacteria group bacterium]
MRFRDTYKIARSQLRRSSRRTTLTILAVTVSIGFMVILISLGAGLKEISLRRIATVSELSRMTVTSDVGRGNILTNQTIGRIQKIDGVRAVYPQILLSGKIEYNDPVGNKTVLEGGIVGLYAEDFSGRNFLRKIGSTFHAQPAEEVILSAAALKAFPGISAENLLGETIQLTADVPDFLSASSEGNSVTRDFRVIGFVETSDDSVQMYVPLPIAAVWTKGQYPAAVVEVTDPKMLTAVSGRIEAMGFSTTSLANLVENVNQIFLLTQLILGFFGSVSLFVASIGLINTMTIALLERTREIGIMKAVGASSGDVRRLFLLESATIGFWGGLWGIASGVLVGEGLNFLARRAIESFGGDIERLFVTPPEFLIGIFFFAVFLSLVAGIYPSYQASKLNPAEALRYD